VALTDFTSFEDVRAALGVSEDEIDDATLGLPLYEINLIAELESVDLNLIDAFTPLNTGSSDDLSADQKRFVNATRFFATYAVAKQLTSSLPLFSPKEISDGKATLSRYTQDPYKAVIDGVLGFYNQALERLESAFNVVSGGSAASSVTRTYMAISSPSSDPVTGT
jgi:hypothetical protein